MSRRGRITGAAVSLFSFQDIITSVTAIMILLVLILTLELVSRVQQRGVAAEDRRVARDLRQAVDALEREAAGLAEELASLQAAAGRSAEFSEAATRKREREASARAAQLGEEIALLESRFRQAAMDRRRAEADVVAARSVPGESSEHVAAMDARAAEMERANDAERERQRQVTAARGDRPPGTTLVFKRPPGERLRPRLLEVSGEGLTAPDPGGAAARRFPGPGRDLDRWLRGLDASSEYVVVIVRPSGTRLYDDVVEAVKSARLAVGAELVGESMALSMPDGE